MSESCCNQLLSIMRNMLPEGENLLENYYEKMLKQLGLDYVKIDACINNCMLYYKDSKDEEKCRICQHERFKSKKRIGNCWRGIPHKVLRYLPLTPRLQRLYMSRKTVKDMT